MRVSIRIRGSKCVQIVGSDLWYTFLVSFFFFFPIFTTKQHFIGGVKKFFLLVRARSCYISRYWLLLLLLLLLSPLLLAVTSDIRRKSGEKRKRGIKSTASATIFFCLIVWSAKKNKQKHGRTRNTHFASTTRSLDLPWERLCRRNSAPETREIPRLTVTVARTSVYRESFLATYHYHIRRWSTLCCLTFGNHFLRIRTRTVSHGFGKFFTSFSYERSLSVWTFKLKCLWRIWSRLNRSLINTRESFWTVWKPIRNVFWHER